jgi:hypothetical protein
MRGIVITEIVSIMKCDAEEQNLAVIEQQWSSHCAYEYQPKSALSTQNWTYAYGGTPKGNIEAFQATIFLGRDEAGRKDHSFGD